MMQLRFHIQMPYLLIMKVLWAFLFLFLIDIVLSNLR